MGIIDTLSAGFSAVNKRLWLILIPVFLDLFLWLGPKLTAAGLSEEMSGFLNDFSALLTNGTAEQANGAAEVIQMSEQLGQMNFFSFLAWQTPSLIYGQLASPPAGLFNIPNFSIDPGLALSGLIVGMALLNLLLQSAYLGAIAQSIKSGEQGLGSIAGKVGLNWLRLAGFFALIIVGTIAIGTPIALILMLVGSLSPGLASMMTGLLVAIAMWVALYLFFAIAAMFVSDVGPLKASWYSFNIVRRFFWSALGLIILTMVIRLGMSRIWGMALEHPAGVMTAILGNAYIDTGLAAASMIYFQDRFAKWRENAELLAQQARRA